MSSSAQYELTPSPQDVISSLDFSPTSAKLLVSCWDRHVYLYDAQRESEQLLKTFVHPAPILVVRFGSDEASAYSAGVDGHVRHINLATGELRILSTHTSGANALHFSRPHALLISTSWDKTLHIHHTSQPSLAPKTIPLPNKPFALAATSTHLIVAMSARLFHVYTLSSLVDAVIAGGDSEVPPFQIRESSLKFMTRALAAMPSGEGYASSSIEGRVAVEWLDDSDEAQARKYAFKCHRLKAAASSADDSAAPARDIVYPVHALAFHPTNGTFVTGGGDATVAVWDVAAKRRIRQHKALPGGVAALGYAGDGKLLAIATSYQFEEGKENEEVDKGMCKVFVRHVREEDGKEEKKKGGKKGDA